MCDQFPSWPTTRPHQHGDYLKKNSFPTTFGKQCDKTYYCNILGFRPSLESFLGACYHFFVPASDVPRQYSWSLAWNDLHYLACLKLGVNTQ